MADVLRRLAVLTHMARRQHRATPSRELPALRKELELELLLPEDEAVKHPQAEELGYEVVAEPELRTADACLVFGGDGTILRALGRLLSSGVPTLGVNFGNVGFLASLPQEGWRDGLAEMVRGRYSVVELLTVEARLSGQRHTAVNDVVLSAHAAARACSTSQYAISGTPLGTMRCDGMIIATPTGSTAYNLSCGGPLVVWDANVLVLNFVAPHSLGFRPLVLRPDHEIVVRQLSDCGEAEVVIDGHVVGMLGCGDSSARERVAGAGAAAGRARACPSTATSRRSCFDRPAMLAELAIDDLVLIAPARLQFVARPQRHHRRDRRRQVAARPGHRAAHGAEGRGRPGARRRPAGASCRRSSRTARRRLRWRASCRAAGRSRTFINGLVSLGRRRGGGPARPGRLLRPARARAPAAPRPPARPAGCGRRRRASRRWRPRTTQAYQQARELERQLDERAAAGARPRARDRPAALPGRRDRAARRCSPEKTSAWPRSASACATRTSSWSGSGGALTLLAGETEASAAGRAARRPPRCWRRRPRWTLRSASLAERLDALAAEAEDVAAGAARVP